MVFLEGERDGMKKQQRLWRGFLYGAGLLVLTCGITLNTKTLLAYPL